LRWWDLGDQGRFRRRRYRFYRGCAVAGRPNGCPLRASPSKPGEFQSELLTDPSMTVSRHTARATLERAAALRRNQRAPPVASWPILRSRRDDLPPSLHAHYSASSLLPGRPSLGVVSVHPSSWFLPFVTSRLASTPRFPRSIQLPLPGSAHLYAGCRSVRKQVTPELIPRLLNYREVDIV